MTGAGQETPTRAMDIADPNTRKLDVHRPTTPPLHLSLPLTPPPLPAPPPRADAVLKTIAKSLHSELLRGVPSVKRDQVPGPTNRGSPTDSVVFRRPQVRPSPIKTH